MVGGRERIYWGWYVVLGALLITGINYGVRYSFGIFLKPMAQEYQWSRSVVSMGISILILVYGIGGILTGRLIDRIAPRWMITAGSVLMAAGLFLTALIHEPWQFYITYGLFGGIGASCFGVVVCNSSVGKWFIRKRGLAIGISSIGVGAGTMAMAPLAGYVVKVYGWQAGFVLLGVFVLVIGVILSQFLMGRTRPEDYGLMPDGDGAVPRDSGPVFAGGPRVIPSLGSVLRDSRFWILAVCYGLAIMAEMSALVHQVPCALDRNIDKVAAASSLGLVGMASIAGRFFFGWLADHLRDAKYASALGFVLMIGGMILLLWTRSGRMLMVYALLFGFGYGSISTMMPFLLADRFGRHLLGAAYGMLTFLCAGIGGSIGPVITGYVYDLSGSYTIAWLLNLAALVIAAVLILALRHRSPDAAL
jgi:MFS family permease